MDDLVEQARKALDGVTEGPWIATEHRWPQQVGCCPLIGRPLAAHHDMHNVAAANTEADIQFIGTARDLVPAMADRIEALTADLAAAEAKLAQAVEVLERIETASEYFAGLEAPEAPYRYAHETTRRLARAFLATIQPEGEPDNGS